MSFYMRFPEGKGKALTLSYDDGIYQDIQLVEIMNKYGIKGTFNLNSGLCGWGGNGFHGRMPREKCIELFKNSGQEVAVHAYTHPWLEKLQAPNVVYEIMEDRKNLEEMFGEIIRGGAYPFGTYNDEVIEILRLSGIVYFRTVRSTETFDIPKNWLLLDPTCHHNNPRLGELSDRFINEAPDKTPWLFYLWGHSYEFSDNDNWELIEEFSEKISGKDDIWYATNIEIYDYCAAYDSLIFSADLRIVKNPTAADIWIWDEPTDKIIKISAGETMRLK